MKKKVMKNRGRTGGATGGFTYQRADKDHLLHLAQTGGREGSSFLMPKVKEYKAKEGRNCVRILPPTWPDAKHYGYDLYIHWGVGIDNKPILSRAKMLGDNKDPMLKARREIAQSDAEDADQKARDLAPKKAVGVWVIDRNNEQEGPMFWRMPFTFQEDLYAATGAGGEVKYVDHPDKGHDIEFRRAGTGRNNTKYQGVTILPRQTPIFSDPAKQRRVLAFLTKHPIPDILVYLEREEIAALLGEFEEETSGDSWGGKEEESWGEDSYAEEPEEDAYGYEEEEDEEEEEEEERPRRMRKRPLAKKKGMKKRRQAVDDYDMDSPEDLSDLEGDGDW